MTLVTKPAQHAADAITVAFATFGLDLSLQIFFRFHLRRSRSCAASGEAALQAASSVASSTKVQVCRAALVAGGAHP
jgi:hypothetical protein